MPLIGRFIETRYEQTPGTEYLRIDVRDTEGRDSERIYRAVDSSSLRVARKVTRYPLIPYICRIGQIHSFEPRGRGLHATLVLVGPIKREESDIWRKPQELDVPLTE